MYIHILAWVWIQTLCSAFLYIQFHLILKINIFCFVLARIICSKRLCIHLSLNYDVSRKGISCILNKQQMLHVRELGVEGVHWERWEHIHWWLMELKDWIDGQWNGRNRRAGVSLDTCTVCNLSKTPSSLASETSLVQTLRVPSFLSVREGKIVSPLYYTGL